MILASQHGYITNTDIHKIYIYRYITKYKNKIQKYNTLIKVMKEINSSSVRVEEAALNRTVRKGMRNEQKAFQIENSLCKGPEAQ